MNIENNLPKIGFFLHAYQPPIPVQTKEVLERIIQVSYIPVSKTFLNNNELSFTLNINASLTEMLQETKVVDNLIQLAESQQIEFLESGAYHPILPLLPREYQKFQLDYNKKRNQEIIGSNYKTSGVFPPELALDANVAKFLSELNYQYCVASEPTFPFGFKAGLPYFKILNNKFSILRRNRLLSNNLAFKNYSTPDDFIRAIKNHTKGHLANIPIIGMDFETFGEHHAGYHNFLVSCLKKLQALKLSEYIELLDNNNSFEISVEEIRPSSWSTEDYDIHNKIPFPLWDHPLNVLHQMILTLMDILDQAVHWIDLNDIPFNFYKSQQSCQLWWSSEGRFGPDIVRRATQFQVDTLREIVEISNSYSGNRKQAIDMLIDLAEHVLLRIKRLLTK